MEYVLNVLKGTVIGVANAIPGVSGGTMMVILKVFDRLMDILSDLSIKKIKDNFFFLLTIGIGMVIGILGSATVLSYCFEHYYVQTQFFFMGIVAGSLPSVYKEAVSEGKLRPIHAVPFIIGLVLMIAVTIASLHVSDGSVITKLTVPSFVYMFVCLMLAAAAMIMPGLSGSLVMVILGAYQTIIEAISMDNIRERYPLIIPAILGAAAGILLCAKAVSIALKKSRQGTYAAIMGLIVGSFFAIWPRKTAEGGADFQWGMTAVFAFIFLVIGIAVPFIFDKLGSKTAAKE